MNTPRIITPAEVHVGDRIRWEGWTVEGTVLATHEDGIIVYRNDQNSVGDIDPTDGGTLTLLDRPLPPIPEVEGTIIRTRSRRGEGIAAYRGYSWWLDGACMPAGWHPDPAKWVELVEKPETSS